MKKNKVILSTRQSEWLSSLIQSYRMRVWLEDIGRYEDVLSCLNQGWYCKMMDRGWLLELRELYLRDWVYISKEDCLY